MPCTKVSNPHGFIRHQKYSCSDFLLHLKHYILPFSPGFANKVCYKKGSTSKAYLQFFIIIQPEEISNDRGHLTEKYTPDTIIDGTMKQKMNLIFNLYRKTNNFCPPPEWHLTYRSLTLSVMFLNVTVRRVIFVFWLDYT